MRAGRRGGTIRVLAAIAVLGMLVGCRVPGASFGAEPLQVRFAGAVGSAVEAEEARREAGRIVPPFRTSEGELIVLASGG